MKLFGSFIQLTRLFVCFAGGLVAGSNVYAHHTAGYHTHPKAIEMAKQLEAQHGIASSETLSLLKQAKKLPKVIEAVKPPKKKSARHWDKYRARFVEDFRISKGTEFWAKHETILRSAEQRYGIPANVIVAIIGVETLYGRHIGKDRVLDALATLAFDYPKGQKDRSEFFQSELAAFIVLCENTHLDPTKVKGSFAGAIGLGQFMPSSWQSFAVDGDNDGKIDLFNSKTDAIFSVANFLKVHGWVDDSSLLVPVEITSNKHLPTLLEPDIIPTFTPREMIQKGLKLKRETLDHEKLALIELVRGEDSSSYVVGGQNFYVVTRYNRSSFYATAVLELAEALQTRRQLTNTQAQTPGETNASTRTN